MATSGTVGQTIFRTREVIDMAARRYKKNPALLSGEQLDSALKNLWLILTGFASVGAPVWKLNHVYAALQENDPNLALPIGTVEVSGSPQLMTVTRVTEGGAFSDGGGTPANAFDDDLSTALVNITPAGHLDLVFAEPQDVVSIGILPAVTGSWDFSIELAYSDGRDSLVIDTFTAEPVYQGRWIWVFVPFDAREKFASARLQASGTTVLNVTEMFVGANPVFAGTLHQYNKDEYFSLPNKNSPGAPNSCWQDVRRDRTYLRVWPVPRAADVGKYVEAMAHEELQDVGTLRQQLDIPNRYFDAVIARLAERMADEDPDFKGDIDRLERKANDAQKLAFSGVTAKGSLNIMPRIGGYTR